MLGESTTTPNIVSTDTSTAAVDDFEQQSNLDAAAATIGLSIKQAAAVLGKSLRALERSLTGKWGNKLPEGWQSRRIQTDSGLEWRLIPPPGFTPKASVKSTAANLLSQLKDFAVDNFQPGRALLKFSDDDLEDQPTIVIDRGDEVERLLRELLQTQKLLSEERRQRMEDLRTLTQLQGSMRLLEDKASQAANLKEELTQAQKEFEQLKQEYTEFLHSPWWKRLFPKGK